jgi:diguanylate cyclase (GGDEF)-like protein
MLNRERIFAAIEAQVAMASNDGGRFAVLIVRVRGLRDITLRFGYAQGELGEEKARELIAQSLRPVDQVYRAGDDSFAVILPGMRHQNHTLLAASRLIRAFELPMNTGATPWHGHAIMGVALFPQDGIDADALCRHAEMALDEALRRGDQYAFYQPHDTQVEIVHEELRDAIETNRLRAYFQPVWDLQKGNIAGVESLARWSSERHGEVSPANFVLFAEQSDLISALTRWSINATLRHAAPLQGARELTFAINFSPRVFAKPGIVEQLMDALDIWGMEPTSVIAEITETALVNDLEQSMRMLARLRDRGVGVAIDDFGTGYASIAYLRKFPATELKIDQSLTADMGSDAQTARLVHSIVNMSHHMGLTVVAEGVEDQATQDLLTGMGCDYGQGYHLGRPEPASDFVARFKSGSEAYGSIKSEAGDSMPINHGPETH